MSDWLEEIIIENLSYANGKSTILRQDMITLASAIRDEMEKRMPKNLLHLENQRLGQSYKDGYNMALSRIRKALGLDGGGK